MVSLRLSIRTLLFVIYSCFFDSYLLLLFLGRMCLLEIWLYSGIIKTLFLIFTRFSTHIRVRFLKVILLIHRLKRYILREWGLKAKFILLSWLFFKIKRFVFLISISYSRLKQFLLFRILPSFSLIELSATSHRQILLRDWVNWAMFLLNIVIISFKYL